MSQGLLLSGVKSLENICFAYFTKFKNLQDLANNEKIQKNFLLFFYFL